MLEIRLLGQFSVHLKGNPIDIPSRPTQSLLAYLVMNPGTQHRREKLAGMYWPEASETNARNNLRHALWRLRKALERDVQAREKYFSADKIAISFIPESDCWVDALRLGTEYLENDSPNALMDCLSLYGGELLPGFYEDWVILERERLRACFEERMHNLLDLLLSAGRSREVLDWAERWIAFGHVPEPAYRALMLAYNALSDVANVAATYRRCSQALRQELGVKPSPITRTLYQDLIAGETSAQGQAIIGDRGASAVMAVRTLLHRWEQKGDPYLDLPSLAMVYACRSDLHFEPQEIALLIRSALYHGIEAGPWLRRAGSPEIAEGALREILASSPPTPVRLRVVEAAQNFHETSMNSLLIQISAEEDSAEVRGKAAVAAAQSGSRDEVLENLLADVQRKDDPSALAALIAVADEVGFPDGMQGYPRLNVGLALVQRRWKRDRSLILRQVWRGALVTGIITGLGGAGTPFYRWVMDNQSYQLGLERFALPGWILTSLFSGLFIGFLQGASSGFALGIADSLWQGKSNLRRTLFGALSGLYYAFMWIIFSITALMKPTLHPGLYIPIYIIFGLYFGVGLTLVAPILGTPTTSAEQLRRIIPALILSLPGSMALIYLTYIGQFSQFSLTFAMEIAFLTVGFGLSFTVGNHD